MEYFLIAMIAFVVMMIGVIVMIYLPEKNPKDETTEIIDELIEMDCMGEDDDDDDTD